MLYSRVPRSSAWPSTVNWPYCEYWVSHCACLSSVARDCGVSSDESVSKNTRSPTLTTKSCWLPGVAWPAALACASSPLLAQAEIASAAARTATSRAARKICFTLVIPVPPFSLTYRPEKLLTHDLSRKPVLTFRDRARVPSSTSTVVKRTFHQP